MSRSVLGMILGYPSKTVQEFSVPGRTNERGYRALESEYRRINEFVRMAKETGGQGWEGPNPQRTFEPIEQRKFEIRFGVISQPPVKGANTKNKKAARKRS